MSARGEETGNATAAPTAESVAIDEQTALAEILRAISTSPGDIASTLPIIGRAAQRVCAADQLTILFARGEFGLGWDERRGYWEGSQLGQRGRQYALIAEVIATQAPVRVCGPIESWEERYPQAAASPVTCPRAMPPYIAIEMTVTVH